MKDLVFSFNTVIDYVIPFLIAPSARFSQISKFGKNQSSFIAS